jgi:hypothetical protein
MRTMGTMKRRRETAEEDECAEGKRGLNTCMGKKSADRERGKR